MFRTLPRRFFSGVRGTFRSYVEYWPVSTSGMRIKSLAPVGSSVTRGIPLACLENEYVIMYVKSSRTGVITKHLASPGDAVEGTKVKDFVVIDTLDKGPI